MKEIIIDIDSKTRYIARQYFIRNRWKYMPIIQRKFFLVGWTNWNKVEFDDAWDNVYGIDEDKAIALGEKVKRNYLNK